MFFWIIRNSWENDINQSNYSIFFCGEHGFSFQFCDIKGFTKQSKKKRAEKESKIFSKFLVKKPTKLIKRRNIGVKGGWNACLKSTNCSFCLQNIFLVFK
jgi:hypothetical protein